MNQYYELNSNIVDHENTYCLRVILKVFDEGLEQKLKELWTRRDNFVINCSKIRKLFKGNYFRFKSIKSPFNYYWKNLFYGELYSWSSVLGEDGFIVKSKDQKYLKHLEKELVSEYKRNIDHELKKHLRLKEILKKRGLDLFYEIENKIEVDPVSPDKPYQLRITLKVLDDGLKERIERQLSHYGDFVIAGSKLRKFFKGKYFAFYYVSNADYYKMRYRFGTIYTWSSVLGEDGFIVKSGNREYLKKLQTEIGNEYNRDIEYELHEYLRLLEEADTEK